MAPPKQPLLIRTHSLSADTDRILELLSREAADVLGWQASNSAILRALLRYAARQPAEWKSRALFPLIAQEIAAGVRRGYKKQVSY
jgi:hypothetical protein